MSDSKYQKAEMTIRDKKIQVLFDESGTPTFKKTKDSNFFLGVAVLYDNSEEDNIFNVLDTPMGLSNLKPLKNDRISKQKAVNIAQELTKHNLYITAKYIDLRSNKLQENTKNYMLFGNFSRSIFRGVDERKDAHFLHSQILDTCLFDVIARFLEKYAGNYRFEILIDDWNYPTTDRHIITDYSPESLQNHLQELINDYKITDIRVHVNPIQFLNSLSDKKKRFIDVATSIISRSLLSPNNPKFDLQPIDELRQGLKNNFVLDDVTAEVINFTHDVLYKDIQETKVKENSKIII